VYLVKIALNFEIVDVAQEVVKQDSINGNLFNEETNITRPLIVHPVCLSGNGGGLKN